jgi:glucosyl-3-phosphoglycerate synthase
MKAVARTFHHRDFPVAALLDAKGATTISVCLPARNEAATVGEIVSVLRRQLVDTHPLVDEVLVVDDGSADATASAARDAGARVVINDGSGKGDAMATSLRDSVGDLVVWCDADVQHFDPVFVTGLLGPLLMSPDVVFVKGFYERPLDGRPGEGGRVTELMARPLLRVLFPHLIDIVQPLAGECAGRREALEKVPFAPGYGVDLALLIDVAARFGVDTVAQVDLGIRVHRNRPLSELSEQATDVLRAALARAGG